MPFTVHIRLDNHLNSHGSIQPLTRNLVPRLTNLPSQVPISSWVERSTAAWSVLPRGTTSSRTGRVLNPGLDLDPNAESCTLPLDQLAPGQPPSWSMRKWANKCTFILLLRKAPFWRPLVVLRLTLLWRRIVRLYKTVIGGYRQHHTMGQPWFKGKKNQMLFPFRWG